MFVNDFILPATFDSQSQSIWLESSWHIHRTFLGTMLMLSHLMI